MKLVKSHLQRWQTGDLAALWAEAVNGGKSLLQRGQSRSTSSPSQQNHKIKYSKAIKILADVQ